MCGSRFSEIGLDTAELQAKNCRKSAKNEIFCCFPAVFGLLLGHPSANLDEILIGHWGMLWLFEIQILLGSDVIWPSYGPTRGELLYSPAAFLF